MRNQVASEVRKLATTRSVYLMAAGLIVIVGIGVVATTTSIKPAGLVGPLEDQVFLNVSLTIAPLFGLLLGLRSFTDEFRFGSIAPTLLASPVRRRVLGAKRSPPPAGASCSRRPRWRSRSRSACRS